MTQIPFPVHTFHIPVMGTGFTIDTPLRVARYGISSVLSLVDDRLIEQMRRYHAERNGEPYTEITDANQDPRANRITAYLNLLDRLVTRQFDTLRNAPFEPESEIVTYFELLPDSPLRNEYFAMLRSGDPRERSRRQAALREQMVPGTIDVNIMTKLDRERYVNGVKMPPEFSDARAALRGFARSTVPSSIVCSAGMNREMYAYMTHFDDFYPDVNGVSKKGIILKVSDYRSAEIQGKFLARKGLWVSEFRVESGLNCGGHAFATKGYLLGPIMEEFTEKLPGLRDQLHGVYARALATLGRTAPAKPDGIRLTVQGGIGTSAEHELFLKYYRADSIGWGTPFLLVPEAVNVDDSTLAKLATARSDDVYLSDSSPLGVPFWNLRTSASEERRREAIRSGHPGSPCRKGHLMLDTSISDTPLCRASGVFQRRKLDMLEREDLPADEKQAEREAVLVKSCICHDLAGGATVRFGIDPEATPAVCCGPNIVNFSGIATLREMIDHIYGRISLLTNPERPSLFVSELMVYLDYYRKEVEQNSRNLTIRTQEYLTEFRENLLVGIDYYLSRAEQFIETKKDQLVRDMQLLRAELESIQLVTA